MSVVHTDFSLIPKFLRRADNIKSSAPSSEPTPKSIDGVPEKLTEYFTHKFENVDEYLCDWSYGERYGIFTKNGKKYYFEIVTGDMDQRTKLFRELQVKLCPEDTSVRVYFNKTGPKKINQWKEFTLHQADMKDVFFIKQPKLYFDGLKRKQEIWPVQAAPTTAAPVSRSFSNEGNPYFI